MEPKRTESKSSKSAEKDAKRDPVAGEQGAHAVGVGAGAVCGGVAEALMGVAIGGPIGGGVGAVGGAVSGGVAGKSAAEAINPTTEHEFWRKEHSHRPYFTLGTPYDQYGPAFQYGWESYASCTGKAFEDVESELAREWRRHRGASKLSWEHAKRATHDAWQRVEKAFGKDDCE